MDVREGREEEKSCDDDDNDDGREKQKWMWLWWDLRKRELISFSGWKSRGASERGVIVESARFFARPSIVFLVVEPSRKLGGAALELC
jgi:hypothetical protein